ncbi:MAG: hypothetical protein ACYC7E_22445 [Armatimonadota bacterium]
MRATYIVVLLVATMALAAPHAGSQGVAGGAPVQFASPGVTLPGCQLRYDSGFDIRDWNGDGLPDLLLPNSSMMAFHVHLNEGTRMQPRFGRAVGYPVNLTETTPQTIEHCMAFAPCDLNHDGLFDMIFFDGQLRMDYNTGTAHGPNHWHLDKTTPHLFPGSDKMIAENARYATGPESMYWSKGIFGRQVLTMTVADWDGDGLEDLLVCRFKNEAPGIKKTGAIEQWTSWGRVGISKPRAPAPAPDEPTYLERLKQAPPRGLYFYKNTGTKEKPWFDAGVEILTPDGASIAAPNPLVADVDGDQTPDLISTETAYRCNAFRVDWPTAPSVVWFRRGSKDDPAQLEPARPLADAAGKPIPAGVQARLYDFRGNGVQDLFVMDAGLQGSLRWYKNTAQNATARPAFAPPVALTGEDFLRFDFMYQPLVVDWFGKGSRDLILHGCTDAHCKWALRRTVLYKNVATRPGEIKYTFAGWLNFRGDLAMVPQTSAFESRPYDVYGSAVSLLDDGSGKKRLVMSVDGKLYLFTDLAADGVTFQQRTPLNIPNPTQNRCRDWQDIPVNVPEKVRYIRIGNDRNGMGNLRDSFLHIVNFEAIAGGKNVATVDQGIEIKKLNKETVRWYQVQNPTAMFTPGNGINDDKPSFTSFGYYIGPAVITLKEPVALEKIRFLLSDRESIWYEKFWPFFWQGKLLRMGSEQGEAWYNYTVEVSADEQKWTVVADRMNVEMNRSVPVMVDWDQDGKVDLLLGVQHAKGIWPSTKEYRLYRNTGTNDAPEYQQFEPICDENGKPLSPQAFWYNAYGIQCGIAANDLDRDGKLDLIVEGFQNNDLLYYRNVSADPGKELRFKLVKSLGDPQPIWYDGRYRFFYVGDVDKDGVADLLNSTGEVTFFKGTAPTAPARVTELLAIAAAGRTELRWKRPRGAVKYDIRYREGDEPDEIDWANLTGTTGDYAVPEGEVQSVKPALPAGKWAFAAVRSLGADGAVSAISESARVTMAPLKSLVLRNGPAGPAGEVEYNGAAGCYLNAEKPAEVAPVKPSVLTVMAHSKNQRVILLRFANLPATGKIERAFLELTTDQSLQENPALQQNPATLPVSCNSIRNDWDAAKATFQEAAPGVPWAKDELMAGGSFLSKAAMIQTVRPRHTIRWDVTKAVLAATSTGGTVSLLIRADYTGYYIDGRGYRFCGMEFPAVNQRPRLVLLSK